MTQTQAENKLSSISGKYLTFSLSAENYGIQILKVQEIIGVMHITKVPSSPDYLKGVINLRGKIIPVVDLRLKFNLTPIPYDEKTCIIVVDALFGERKVSVGIVVDTVLEVTLFSESSIEPAPEYGVNLSSSFIKAMGRTPDNNVVILIDIEQVLADTPARILIQNEASKH